MTYKSKTWKTYNFFNPLRQNYGHIKALQSVTGLQESSFKNNIIFALRGNLKKIPNNKVFGLYSFYRYYTILQKQKVKQIFKNRIAMEKAFEKIKEANIKGITARIKHAYLLNKKYNK